MRFKNTLQQFHRKDNIEVDVGDGFIITVRKASVHNQEFRAKVAEFSAKKASKNSKRVSVVSQTGGSISGTNDPKQDAEFFYNVFVVGWRGLKDDSGKPVKPSLTVGIELFGSTKEGQMLMELILAETTKDENFVIEQAQEERIAEE